MKNRLQRRAGRKALQKELHGAVMDRFVDVTASALEIRKGKTSKHMRFARMWTNAIYSVQEFHLEGRSCLGIRRHDQKSSCPWAHKQKIKNELWGEEVVCVELFPAQSDLVNMANMYWLWLYDDIELKGFHIGGE